ncbi:hypothetical protein J2Y55_004053 [Bosea sp. BE125]|uniref:hypothetical protein n=1 Tax=Bosea sp. BE125 TaxID=2817909 RepID=UPI002860DE84|nr:hypothetical protein [Bosea sp. BE125]MDR6873029.1 hypothetical protein [Bosea sp. BE125]
MLFGSPRRKGTRLLIGRAIIKAWRGIGFTTFTALKGTGLILLLMFLGNLIFHSARGIPYRALDPDSKECRTIAVDGTDVLAPANPASPQQKLQIANDEWEAIRVMPEFRTRLSCAVQRHIIHGYKTPSGRETDLEYNLAFLEFQEDGKPYAVRELCEKPSDACRDEGFGLVRLGERSQLNRILATLNGPEPQYVVVFIHGWRHDASIGDSNVSELRQYAAHVTRFLEDRHDLDPTQPKPRVTALFVGWRGARTDETWLRHRFGKVGEWVGTFSAILTLFDRKPVSEAIAPSVLSGLRAVESKLGMHSRRSSGDPEGPVIRPNRMIVFGHSLGGNLLATALQDDLIKKVELHKPNDTMQPVLGDLVVLLNPAAEAKKWTDVQRAVWRKLPIAENERRVHNEYERSNRFFRSDQRPVVVSVTSALDWPPGGRRALDCVLPTPLPTSTPNSPASTSTATPKLSSEQINSANNQAEKSDQLVLRGVDYDWATYDMFPAFKGDLRPIADSLIRMATGHDPHNECDHVKDSWWRSAINLPVIGISAFMRVLPFTQTDPEQTRTIGNLDPPRAPMGSLSNYYVSGRPFGTTHELRGLESNVARPPRKFPNTGKNQSNELSREVPLDYEEIIGPNASCPIAGNWLSAARRVMTIKDPGSSGMYWTSIDSGESAPALQFIHGFSLGGVAAITRANDPFWNMRAFDTALARHDGYMLSSFICAMNQLVMDQITQP